MALALFRSKPKTRQGSPSRCTLSACLTESQLLCVPVTCIAFIPDVLACSTWKACTCTPQLSPPRYFNAASHLYVFTGGHSFLMRPQLVAHQQSLAHLKMQIACLTMQQFTIPERNRCLPQIRGNRGAGAKSLFCFVGCRSQSG